MQIYNTVLCKIMESLKLKREGRIYCDDTRQKVYRDMMIIPGFFATLQITNTGVVLIVHPRTRVLASMTAYSFINRPGFNARDLLGRKVVTAYGTKKRQYIVFKIDRDSSPKSTFELKDGSTVTYAEYYKNNYGLDISDMTQPLLWGERFGKVRLVPELVLVDQLSPEARRFLPARCSKMPGEHHEECLKLVGRLSEDAPHRLLDMYGLKVEKTPKLERVNPTEMRPVIVTLMGAGRV
eukprot:PhF_6_TR23246/c0_g1_i2/m.32608/K02156/AUB, PIWI; aubergine